MDERTRIWQEVGLRFILRTPHDGPEVPLPEKARTDSHEGSEDVTRFDGKSAPVTDGYPAPLIIYRQRLHPPISAFVTYAHLDADLRGQTNQERLGLIQAIIDKAMPWKAQEVAFWPASLNASPHVSNKDIETALLRVCNEFDPKYILDFGGCISEALANTFQKQQSEIFQPHSPIYVVLPSLDDMLPDNKPVKKVAWDIIRRLIP